MKTKVKRSKVGNAREEVWKVFHSLCKAAHSPACNHVFDHPKKHEECRANLDLRVALVWELADGFSDLFSYLSRRYLEHQLTKPEVHTQLQKMSLVMEAYDRLASRPDFKPLRPRIRKAQAVMELVAEILREN